MLRGFCGCSAGETASEIPDIYDKIELRPEKLTISISLEHKIV